MFGLPHEISELQEMEIVLKDGASLKDLIASLRRETPVLEGHVIRTGEDSLVDRYMFNIEGRFYFSNMEFQLKGGEHIRLLTLAAGG